MNFLLTKFPDPVEIISSDKNVIFVKQNLLAFKKTPLCSMKWCDQKFESKMTGPAGGGHPILPAPIYVWLRLLFTFSIIDGVLSCVVVQNGVLYFLTGLILACLFSLGVLF